ncbi:hypothetical protein [Alkalinema sp. FACHB-956]|uniref:hypothetical protein n=1 Tax=Alkalinema sp. FACHB-956 TaxID=2692768 RepID=UPI00168806DA|nr:hypothetical protein [Alkalinema sp. FACHB-956]MBD2326676.1 hypothetical protein [Alkalinema sp. FACHB-956]
MESTSSHTCPNPSQFSPATGQSRTIVLQPSALTGSDGNQFQNSLDRALQQAESVIVDLLWVDSIEDEGLTVLFAGMQQAFLLNKPLSFLSMDRNTRSALDHLWEQQRDQEHLLRDEVFTAEFESFLSDCRPSYAASMEF